MKAGGTGGVVRLLVAGRVSRGLVAGGIALALAAAPAAAQERQEDCRCVDADGNEIENCTCLRMPRMAPMVMAHAFSDVRPRLGVSVSASRNGEGDARGARVTNVLADGPADDAGLREGDVITRLDGRSLVDPLPADEEDELDPNEPLPVQRLLTIAAELEPGQEVEVEYLRGGETRTTTVVADDLSPWGGHLNIFGPDWEARLRGYAEGEAPEGLRDFQWRYEGPGSESGAMLLRRFGAMGNGLELAEINPELGAYFGTEEGVLVLDVAEDSELGLQPGDVIVRIGSREATSPERVRRILSSYGSDETVTFDVRRDGRDMSVSGRRGGL